MKDQPALIANDQYPVGPAVEVYRSGHSVAAHVGLPDPHAGKFRGEQAHRGMQNKLKVVVARGRYLPEFLEVKGSLISRQQSFLDEPLKTGHLAQEAVAAGAMKFRQVLRKVRARRLQIARPGRMPRMEALRALPKVILADQAPGRREARYQAVGEIGPGIVRVYAEGKRRRDAARRADMRREGVRRRGLD